MPLPAVIGATAQYWAPALLSLISGRIGSGAEAGRMKDLRSQLERLLSAESIGSETNKLFDIFRSSPMYSGIRNQAMTGATSLANSINARAYRSGLGGSGINAVAEPLARSSFQQTFANIDSDMFREALSTARANLGARAGIIERTNTPDVWGSGLGRGIESYLPYLFSMLLKQQGMPGMNGMSAVPGGYNTGAPRIAG
jgi:hypothetical protein